MTTSKTVRAILNKEDKAVEHILNQNKYLFEQLGVVRNELEAMKKNNEELESDNDSLCKSKTVMQGFLKNIHELNTLEKKINAIYHGMCRDVFWTYYVTIFVCVLYNLLVLQVEDKTRQGVACVTVSCVLIVNAYYMMKYRLRQHEYLRKVEDDRVKTQRATDLVNELFDNI